jgi:hypothetical protein
MVQQDFSFDLNSKEVSFDMRFVFDYKDILTQHPTNAAAKSSRRSRGGSLRTFDSNEAASHKDVNELILKSSRFGRVRKQNRSRHSEATAEFRCLSLHFCGSAQPSVTVSFSLLERPRLHRFVRRQLRYYGRG